MLGGIEGFEPSKYFNVPQIGQLLLLIYIISFARQQFHFWERFLCEKFYLFRITEIKDTIPNYNQWYSPSSQEYKRLVIIVYTIIGF